ncbi:hypothetical protein V6N12_028145 [Hibiscus sabdariffa]|uniref:Uncharacterized protein n=1 Tax=Hibiscus sabdariffa TaxID=183260 RepID=A0ABR2F506_9ROSI
MEESWTRLESLWRKTSESITPKEMREFGPKADCLLVYKIGRRDAKQGAEKCGRNASFRNMRSRKEHALLLLLGQARNYDSPRHK